MKELEIQILENVTDGTFTTDYMLRRLLLLYDVRERYFYHFSYKHNEQQIHTDELIECNDLTYKVLCSNEKYKEDHRPVKYMSDQIPTNKKLRRILYKR